MSKHIADCEFIETHRLLLIPPTKEYAPVIFRNFTDEVTVYMGPCPAKEIAETEKIIEAWERQRAERTDYVFAITNKETAEFLGMTGLHDLNGDAPELGIRLKIAAHGNHFGREAIGILNLCAPCGCACKYCLLQSRKVAEGVEYFRGKRLAERFREWASAKNMSPLPYYAVAFCAEYPALPDNVAYNRSVGFIGAKFLQCNGIRLRNASELTEWLAAIKSAGVELIDTTFYGDAEFHDAFAARKGDFEFMFELAAAASAIGVECRPSVVIMKENLAMLDTLIGELRKIPHIGRVGSFLPHHRGRGCLLEDSRITAADYDSLSESVKSTLNIQRYKTQKEWLAMDNLPEYTERALQISLREDNIELFENMSCDEIVGYVERLDDGYYNALPSVNELAAMYGDRRCEKLYRLRDLFWMWQKRYVEEARIELYDATDERMCGAVRR